MTNSADSADASRLDLDRLPRWAPPVVFAILTLGLFAKYILAGPGQMLVGQDTIAAGIMFRSFFVEQYHELGRLPLWNPYMFGGVPTIEAGSGDILYPTSVLHFLLPLTAALAWKLIVHVYLAGVFMYLAARAFGVRRYVALFAGSAYLLSANLVSLVYGGQDGKMYVMALFPAGLWLLKTALDTRSLLRFTWLGAVLGLMLVAHPQLAYYAYLALAGYAVGSLWSRRKQGSGQVARILGGGLVAAVIAIGVAAFVLFPMYRYLRTDSPRSGAGKGFEHAASYSLHAAETFSLFDPDFVGTGAEPGTYWGKNPLKDNTEYGGVLVLVLGVGAVIALKHDRRRWGLAAISAVALLYGLGAGTPFFRIVYTVLPGVKSFRAPSLATFLFIACATILSAMLLERVLAERDEYAATILSRSLLIGAGLALLVTVFAAAGGDALYTFWTGIFGDAPGGRSAAFQANLPHLLIGSFLTFVWCAAAWGAVLAFRRGALSARMCVLSLTAITVLDLARVDLRYLQVASYADFFPADPGIDALRTTLGPGERVLDFPGVFPSAGYLATNRIPQVFGYHGNQLRWYDDLTRVSVRDGATTQEQLQKYWFDFLNSPVLKALAARIIIFPGKIDLPGMQRIGGDERVSILRNSSAMPGAWLVSRVVVEPDSAKQIDMLWRPDFDVATEAVTASALPSMQQGGGTGKAEFTSDAADSVVLKTTASGPAVVVLSRNFHPSWNVTIDGAPASVARVDYALLGVPVSAGTHTVVFRYRPAIVVTTRRVTLATWAAVLMLTLALAGVRYFPRASRA